MTRPLWYCTSSTIPAPLSAQLIKAAGAGGRHSPTNASNVYGSASCATFGANTVTLSTLRYLQSLPSPELNAMVRELVTSSCIWAAALPLQVSFCPSDFVMRGCTCITERTGKSAMSDYNHILLAPTPFALLYLHTAGPDVEPRATSAARNVHRSVTLFNHVQLHVRVGTFQILCYGLVASTLGF